MSGRTATNAHWRGLSAVAQDPASWTSGYLGRARLVDGVCALAAGLLAFKTRFNSPHYAPVPYLALSLCLPLLWLIIVALAGGYDSRFIGVGTDEFRKILNAGICLIAAVAVVSYATKAGIARGYVVIALPLTTIFDLGGRYVLRKRLHKLRRLGSCMRKVVVVGHPSVAANLTRELRRGTYHGLSVVAACLAVPPDPPGTTEIAGVPAVVGLNRVTKLVENFGADTVAVLACPEMKIGRAHV